MSARFGNTELPAEQERALRRAVRLEWVWIAYLVTAVIPVYLVMGSSQAMKAAWAEDMLSFIPPIALLVAVRVTRRPPSPKHPYGYHRAIGVGHLVAATALLSMGALLVWDSATLLVKAEHPPVGLMEIAGREVWSGWLMIIVLVWTGVPPVIFGRLKLPLARTLHDRVLFADADMNKADWMTAGGAVVGVLGIGVGLWWADAVAALFISASIVRDGVTNLRVATAALMDARASTYDGAKPHPLLAEIDRRLEALPWVAQARSRVRDLGHVFHVESFVVPAGDAAPSLADLAEAREEALAVDWKIQDMVVVPVRELPEEFLPGVHEEVAGHDAGR
ncbi:cation transporter [Georgenia thermotolerans]|uniref:Cation transporter n=1 Tax=Georgenia thermotolerans TaxID=527326 RepID=A0A7J5UMI7_9MICO|nr:cation transporter [Georgenia thermotolerans]KAE8763589.1 cation transporter [Georgenia thermotolerans]